MCENKGQSLRLYEEINLEKKVNLSSKASIFLKLKIKTRPLSTKLLKSFLMIKTRFKGLSLEMRNNTKGYIPKVQSDQLNVIIVNLTFSMPRMNSLIIPKIPPNILQSPALG